MRYVAAYLLAVIGGSKSPSAEEIEKILSSVGIEAEKDKLTKVISELNGKNVQQLIDEGKGKLATMPAGGGAAAASAPAAGGGSAPAAAEKKEEKKKVEEKSESEDEDMGFGLFD